MKKHIYIILLIISSISISSITIEVCGQVKISYVGDSIEISNGNDSFKIWSLYRDYGEFISKSPICLLDEQNRLFLYNPRYAIHKLNVSNLELEETVYFKNAGKERKVQLYVNENYLLLSSSERIELYDKNLKLLKNYLPCVRKDSKYYEIYLRKDRYCELNCDNIKIEVEYVDSENQDVFYRQCFFYDYPRK